jgi:outer membrane lipoprotein-sorting protein
MVPLKQELYGKSGQLLKQIEFSDVKQVQGKWFPHTMLYRDMLSDGKGTKFHITAIQFNQVIPPHFFTKAMLKK